jgi:putative ABC transport system substrate-binding protein
VAARGLSQQPAKLPAIGFLGAGAPSSQGQWFAALVQRLRELGWIAEQPITIEVRWAEGRTERYVEIATEFVRLKVDVIATYATSPTIAANQATAVIPIVFAVMGDPVGVGLPAVYNQRVCVEAGGLMSYGPDNPDLRPRHLASLFLRHCSGRR